MASKKPTPRQIMGRKLLRVLAGAAWSLPFRFVTIPLIAGAMVLTAGGTLTAQGLLQPAVVLSGIALSFVLRLLDGLIVEFVLHPALLWVIKRR